MYISLTKMPNQRKNDAKEKKLTKKKRNGLSNSSKVTLGVNTIKLFFFFSFFPLEYDRYSFSYEKKCEQCLTNMYVYTFFGTRIHTLTGKWINFKISPKVKNPGC